MDSRVEAAIIAGIVSVIVSLIAYIVGILKIRNERLMLEKKLNRNLTEKLYSIRLDAYPEGFEITADIGKFAGRSDEEVSTEIIKTRKALKSWSRKKVSFLLSEKALDAFYKLDQALKKNPGDNTTYTAQQRTKIWEARNRFRSSLREDVGLLFEEDV